ncbi:hypothetical protein RHECNPAF_6420014 [Rhizobium etli CNPAF512]|nr:hypothetical protein RHECNPAF_6420014 [Rhizobium etli CNPAF512]
MNPKARRTVSFSNTIPVQRVWIIPPNIRFLMKNHRPAGSIALP